MCLLLPRVCFIQDISRDLFREDLGQIILLWEYILAPIWRKTRSVLRSRFSTALWPPFGTAFLDFWCSRPPQKEPLLQALSVHVAIQRRPEVENWGFWGGLVAEFFFEEILHHFWRGPGQWKRWFRMGGVAKITISPKSEFYHFLSSFWGSFWNQHLSKMALGLAMGRPG